MPQAYPRSDSAAGGPERIGETSVIMTTVLDDRESARGIERRVQERVHQRRRNRLVRSVAIFALVMTVMTVLTVFHRDEQTRRRSRRQSIILADALQKELVRSGRSPHRVPVGIERGAEYEQRFEFNTFYVEDGRTRKEVAVAWPRSATPLMSRSSGRFVVLFDHEHYFVRWLTDREFETHARELGCERFLLSDPDH